MNWLFRSNLSLRPFFSFSFLCAQPVQDWELRDRPWVGIATDSFLKSEANIWWGLSNHPLELKCSLNSGSLTRCVKEISIFGSNGYELLERSLSLAPSSRYWGQQKHFFCVGDGPKIETATKITQTLEISLFLSPLHNLGHVLMLLLKLSGWCLESRVLITWSSCVSQRVAHAGCINSHFFTLAAFQSRFLNKTLPFPMKLV